MGTLRGVLFLLWKQQMNFLMRKDEYFKKLAARVNCEMPRSKAFWGVVIQRLEKFSLDSWIKGC